MARQHQGQNRFGELASGHGGERGRGTLRDEGQPSVNLANTGPAGQVAFCRSPRMQSNSRP
jgi:hypothetical protein